MGQDFLIYINEHIAGFPPNHHHFGFGCHVTQLGFNEGYALLFTNLKELTYSTKLCTSLLLHTILIVGVDRNTISLTPHGLKKKLNIQISMAANSYTENWEH